MKKGFTLAELIAVIVILALISLITIPSVSRTLKQNKIKVCETQLQNIVQAARNYGSDNILVLPNNDGDITEVTLGELITYGYIDGHIVNAVTKEEFDEETTFVKITKNGKKYKYELVVADADACDSEATDDEE